MLFINSILGHMKTQNEELTKLQPGDILRITIDNTLRDSSGGKLSIDTTVAITIFREDKQLLFNGRGEDDFLIFHQTRGMDREVLITILSHMTGFNFKPIKYKKYHPWCYKVY